MTQVSVKSKILQADEPRFDSSPKTYKAKVTSAGDGASDPTVNIVSENNLGGVPVITQYDVGKYHITLAGAFPLTKTYLRIGNFAYAGFVVENQDSGSTVNVIEFGTLNNSNTFNDGLLSNTEIEIKVYP